MPKKAFAFFDRVAESYSDPFLAPSSGVVMRDVSDAVRKGEGTMAQHPDDFDLVQLGVYDSATGVAQFAPVLVCRVSSLQVE